MDYEYKILRRVRDNKLFTGGVFFRWSSDWRKAEVRTLREWKNDPYWIQWFKTGEMELCTLTEAIIGKVIHYNLRDALIQLLSTWQDSRRANKNHAMDKQNHSDAEELIFLLDRYDFNIPPQLGVR